VPLRSDAIVRRKSLGLLAATLLSLARPAAADDLLVFAAASLTDVLGELGGSYERAEQQHVAFNFGASSDLARQIEAGAPADAFFSADAARVEQLERAGLVRKDERRDVLSNVLVVIAPADSTLTIGGPADLKRVGHLALANPDAVPAGMYAASWLRTVGVWDAVRDAVVPQVDVRAALASVEAGRADAGIVYATDAALSKRVRVAYRVPRDQGPPIVYALAPLVASTKPATRAFVRFLTSKEARASYEKYGFIVLPPE